MDKSSAVGPCLMIHRWRITPGETGILNVNWLLPFLDDCKYLKLPHTLSFKSPKPLLYQPYSKGGCWHLCFCLVTDVGLLLREAFPPASQTRDHPHLLLPLPPFTFQPDILSNLPDSLQQLPCEWQAISSLTASHLLWHLPALPDTWISIKTLTAWRRFTGLNNNVQGAPCTHAGSQKIPRSLNFAVLGAGNGGARCVWMSGTSCRGLTHK